MKGAVFHPDFITLRIFLAVYNLGNISKAAARENIASSAISKRLNALEADWARPCSTAIRAAWNRRRQARRWPGMR